MSPSLRCRQRLSNVTRPLFILLAGLTLMVYGASETKADGPYGFIGLGSVQLNIYPDGRTSWMVQNPGPIGFGYEGTGPSPSGFSLPWPPPAGTLPSRPLLGIMYRPIVLENGFLGMRVVQVVPGSPAQRVGLEPGDVIVRVEGRSFVTPNDMCLDLRSSNGRPVLTVFRVRYGQHVNIITPLD